MGHLDAFLGPVRGHLGATLGLLAVVSWAILLIQFLCYLDTFLYMLPTAGVTHELLSANTHSPLLLAIASRAQLSSGGRARR